jgi:hypothetical protein
MVFSQLKGPRKRGAGHALDANMLDVGLQAQLTDQKVAQSWAKESATVVGRYQIVDVIRAES